MHPSCIDVKMDITTKKRNVIQEYDYFWLSKYNQSTSTNMSKIEEFGNKLTNVSVTCDAGGE
jgi:hypothetical protein